MNEKCKKGLHPLPEIFELKEYIDDLCEARGIPIDLRFYHLADVNRFFSKDDTSYEEFEIKCNEYYAKDVEDIKVLISEFITSLWRFATFPNHKVAIYIKDIIDRDGWYNVIVGGCLFEEVEE